MHLPVPGFIPKCNAPGAQMKLYWRILVALSCRRPQ